MNESSMPWHFTTITIPSVWCPPLSTVREITDAFSAGVISSVRAFTRQFCVVAQGSGRKFSHQRREVQPASPGKPGTREQRPLGIPTVSDRVVQNALRHVLEPIFERDFAEHSYGFRPGRSCLDALARVEALLQAGYTHVVDADLKGYFDTIDHGLLMERIEEKVSDAPADALPRYKALYTALTSGKLEVRFLPDSAFGLIHGKAGVIRYADQPATAFLGSVNESATAWKMNYELLWENDSAETVAWVQEEFAPPKSTWHSGPNLRPRTPHTPTCGHVAAVTPPTPTPPRRRHSCSLSHSAGLGGE